MKRMFATSLLEGGVGSKLNLKETQIENRISFCSD
jgi:hypothetical protein